MISLFLFTTMRRFQPKFIINTLLSYITFRPLLYGYANARVHGLYSNFLTSSQMEEIINSRSVASIAEILGRTSYKKELIDLSLKFRGEELIELALSKNFANFAHTLLALTPNQSKHIVDAIISRWDVHNLKTIILARKQSKKYEDVAPYLMLAGTLTKEQLKGLLEANNSEDFYSKLRLTQFGSGVLTMPATDANGSVRQMILSMGQAHIALEPILAILDVYAYHLIDDVAKMSHREAKEVAPILARYADEKNLSTVLRLAQVGESEQKMLRYLVPGGCVSESKWRHVFELKQPSLMLSKLSRCLPISSLTKYEKTKKISDIEVELSHDTAKKGIMQFRNAQLSLGVIVGALLLKEQEVANIRKIVRSKALGLSNEEIRSMMVLVK